MKPLISYYGGKQRLAPYIVPYLKAIPHTVYCEPFAGGLAVFYARQRPMVTNSHHYREIINDHSELLINLYRVARSRPDEFERLIQFTPYARADYQRAIEICKNPNDYSDLECAWAYYVNIQQSFANKINGGWGCRLHSENGAATWHQKRQRIPECLERLQDVHIDCDDALSVIQRFDSPQTLHYIDPPYPETNCGHYDGYTIDDWRNLCELLDTIQGSYVLSNYPQAVEPQSAQQRIDIEVLCSASGKGKVGKNRDRGRAATAEELGDRKRTEVLWICDRSAGIRDDLQHVLAKRNQLSLFELAT